MSKSWIGYARISSGEQSDTSILENQIELLKRSGAQSVFYDIELGLECKREQLKKALELVANQKVKGLIVTRLDRLTRNAEEYLRIENIFDSFGSQLRLLDQEGVLGFSSGQP